MLTVRSCAPCSGESSLGSHTGVVSVGSDHTRGFNSPRPSWGQRAQLQRSAAPCLPGGPTPWGASPHVTASRWWQRGSWGCCVSPRGWWGARTAPSPSLSSPGDGAPRVHSLTQHRDNGGVAAANYLTIIIVGYCFQRTRRETSL